MSRKTDAILRRNAADIQGATSAPNTTAAGSALLPPCAPAAGRFEGRGKLPTAGMMELARIVADPGQPRQQFAAEELEGLAATIRARGVLQPVRVRWDDALGKWVLVAGERRWRAALLAGLTALPCLFVEGELAPGERLLEQLLENCQRADLNPMDKADALARLLEAQGWSPAEAARQLGLSDQTVLRSLKLRELAPAVQEQVRTGKLTVSVAAELARLEDPAEQAALAARVISDGLKREDLAGIPRGNSGRGGRPPKRTGGPREKMPRLFGAAAETLRFAVPGGTVEVCLVRKLPSDRDLLAITIGPASLLPLPANLRHGDVPGALLQLAAMLEGEAGRAAA